MEKLNSIKDLFIKNKKLVIGILAVVILVIAIILVLMNINNHDKTAKKYCDILVKGNYGDILDIAYFPESEFITKDYIEKAKPIYFEKMKKAKEGIVSCVYSKAYEDDAKITYKLTINGSKTENIEIDKKTNKILIDNLYETKTITTDNGCLVTIDGKEVSNPTRENNKEIYKATLLSNVKYEIKVKAKNGVNDEIINEEIKKASEDSSKITLANRNTDLDNGIDTLTFSREYDDGILSITGSFDIVYKFNDSNYSWEYDKKDNENYKNKWNISGTWKSGTSTILELSENEGKVTGTYKDVKLLLGTTSKYDGVYNSGTLSDEGSIELKGSMTSVYDFGTPNVKESVLKGTINSKEKTIKISISGFLGNWELTKE